MVQQFLAGYAEQPVLCNPRTLWISHRSAWDGSIFARSGSGELRLNLLTMLCDMCWPLCTGLFACFSMGLSRRTQTHVRSPLAVTVNGTSSDPDADPHCAFSAFNFGLGCTNRGSCGQRTWARALSRVSSITHAHTHVHTNICTRTGTPSPTPTHTIRLHLFWISRRIKQLSAQNQRVSLLVPTQSRTGCLPGSPPACLPGTCSANYNRGKNQSDATFALFITGPILV